jgi:hypothetical protein
VNIKYNRDHPTINIHLHNHILTILAKFRMDKSRPVATLMATKLYQRKADNAAGDPTIYQ